MFWLALLAVLAVILLHECFAEPNSLKQATWLGLDEERKEE